MSNNNESNDELNILNTRMIVTVFYRGGIERSHEMSKGEVENLIRAFESYRSESECQSATVNLGVLDPDSGHYKPADSLCVRFGEVLSIESSEVRSEQMHS